MNDRSIVENDPGDAKQAHEETEMNRLVAKELIRSGSVEGIHARAEARAIRQAVALAKAREHDKQRQRQQERKVVVIIVKEQLKQCQCELCAQHGQTPTLTQPGS